MTNMKLVALNAIGPRAVLELRLECVRVYAQIASKYDIEKQTVLEYGEKLWEHILKGLMDDQKENPVKAPSGKK